MKIHSISGLDPKVQNAIESFRDIAPDQSFDACKKTSAQFTQFAQDSGLDAKWINLSGAPDDLEPLGKWGDLPRESWIHYVTKIGNLLIDWTASQFGDNESVPSISLDSTGWNKEYDVTDALGDYLSMLEEWLLEDLL